MSRTIAYPNKINIGCGHDHRPGFLNVDSGDWHHPDLLADVTAMPMLPSGHFIEAVAQDVLEHIGRTQQVLALQEWSRILCGGGMLHVRVPSVVHMVRLLDRPDFFHDIDQHHYWVQMLYGTQAYPGDFHLCGYTCLTLIDVGRQAGLLLAALSIKDDWLFEATFRKVASTDDLHDAEFVAHQYAAVLNRPPDEGGRSYWTAALEGKTVTRPQLIEHLKAARTA